MDKSLTVVESQQRELARGTELRTPAGLKTWTIRRKYCICMLRLLVPSPLIQIHFCFVVSTLIQDKCFLLRSVTTCTR